MTNKETLVSGHSHGVGLHVQTPGRYAMGVAIDVLEYLDKCPGVSVKNTGWKQGFGIEVAAWIPICTQNIVAELQTDGDEFYIRRSSGSLQEFTAVLEAICRFLEDQHNAKLNSEIKAVFERKRENKQQERTPNA